MRRQIKRLLMQLILMSLLLVGCGQGSTPAAPESFSGTRAAGEVVGAVRAERLAQLAHRSAMASRGLNDILANPRESVGVIQQLVSRMAASSVAGGSQGGHMSLWERFARPRSPVLKGSAQSEGWRTWAEEVVDRYN
jgi:hypothetical protein